MVLLMGGEINIEDEKGGTKMEGDQMRKREGKTDGDEEVRGGEQRKGCQYEGEGREERKRGKDS